MVVKGTIFFHENFVFKNGASSEKLIILLNTPDENNPCLFVKTTSREKDKPSQPGCIERLSLFFIPPKTTFFEQPTWVELYEIYEIALSDVKKDPFRIVGELDYKKTDEIINCLLLAEADDITPYHKRLLKPPFEESLEKLREKFQKK